MRATTAYAIAWMSVAAAASVGIITTESLMPLWAFLIPASISYKEGADK